MAKKGQTTKKVDKPAPKVEEVMTICTTNELEKVDEGVSTFATSYCAGDLILTDENAIIEATLHVPSQVKHIKSMSLEELMWVEKACALICRRHETSARIDFENNKKLTQFSHYYKEIMNELEKRVIKVCEIS